MGNGFQFLDIIFFALIAAFLVLRLRNVLGRRNGRGGGRRDPFGLARRAEPENENLVQLPGNDDEQLFDEDGIAEEEPQTPLEAGLAQIRRVDPDFDVEEFLVGARTAFEMIIGAFNAGDEATLKPLVSAEVFANFDEAMRSRDDESGEARLIGIRSSEIVEAFMSGRVANVTVKFLSEQIVQAGGPEGAVEVTDFWTFARDTRSRDPNWTLVATGNVE